MTTEYMYVGIPILNKREGMTYNEDIRFCVSNMDDYDFKIEYLKFEEGTPFPEIPSKQPRVAYRVNDLDHYASQAQKIIFGPADCGPSIRLASVVWGDAIVKFYEER